MAGVKMDNKVVEAEKEFEIKALKEEMRKLRNELAKYKILLKDVDEDASIDGITDAEVICVNELDKLRKSSAERELSSDEIKNMDILHKNLKLAQGKSSRISGSGKAKKLSAEELESLAKES
jgi:hypothetical protein